jgi:hypothetical protein
MVFSVEIFHIAYIIVLTPLPKISVQVPVSNRKCRRQTSMIRDLVRMQSEKLRAEECRTKGTVSQNNNNESKYMRKNFTLKEI